MQIITAGRRYPMTMIRMFDAAFRRLGHTVFTVGPYSGDGGDIPWPGQPKFPQYVDKPDLTLPEHLSSYPLAAIRSRLPDEIDAIFSFDAGFRLTGKIDNVPTVLYGTDPHALEYEKYLNEYDFFFSAQNRLMHGPLPEGSVWVPLAYDPDVHKKLTPISDEDRPIDVAFVGVMGEGGGPENAYRKRWAAVQALKSEFQVFAAQGMIFRECTDVYNRSKISFNWSSSNFDLPMRCWEGWGYGCCVVTNRMPNFEDVGFIDGETCVMYDTQEELIEKIHWLLDSGEWRRIARNGYKAGKEIGATYDDRVSQMLSHMGLA